jgi:hypothetical protein
MTRSQAQSNRRIAGRRSLMDNGSESVEGVEDHQRNQEAPEGREEETGGLYEPMQRISGRHWVK